VSIVSNKILDQYHHFISLYLPQATAYINTESASGVFLCVDRFSTNYLKDEFMNRKIFLAGSVVVALMTFSVQSNAQSNETNEQMCARWAGYQGLQGSSQAEYLKDCQLNLRVPDKEDGGDDE
jgi:hypothetical protein